MKLLVQVAAGQEPVGDRLKVEQAITTKTRTFDIGPVGPLHVKVSQLPKTVTPLGTKCSNTRAYGEKSPPKL